MIVGVFSARRRPDMDEAAYTAVHEKMWSIVSMRPEFGLIGLGDLRYADGRSVAMALFRDREGMLAWKREVEHAQAQQKGRKEFFEEYWGFVAELIDLYEFDAEGGRHRLPLDAPWVPPGFTPGPGAEAATLGKGSLSS